LALLKGAVAEATNGGLIGWIELGPKGEFTRGASKKRTGGSGEGDMSLGTGGAFADVDGE
jgi:hypothetical protein